MNSRMNAQPHRVSALRWLARRAVALLAGLGMIGILPSVLFGAALPPASDINAAVGALRSITSMRADFVQIDANGGRVSGVMLMKAPRKLRFQYQPDYPVLMVADGRALTMVDYQARQVQRWPLHYTPIGLLLDPGRDVSRYARQLPSGAPNLVSILLHDRGHRENGDMTLLFAHKPEAPGGFELLGWEVVDAQSRRTIVRLSHQTYGLDIPESSFTWIDPRHPSRR